MSTGNAATWLTVMVVDRPSSTRSGEADRDTTAQGDVTSLEVVPEADGPYGICLSCAGVWLEKSTSNTATHNRVPARGGEGRATSGERDRDPTVPTFSATVVFGTLGLREAGAAASGPSPPNSSAREGKGEKRRARPGRGSGLSGEPAEVEEAGLPGRAHFGPLGLVVHRPGGVPVKLPIRMLTRTDDPVDLRRWTVAAPVDGAAAERTEQMCVRVGLRGRIGCPPIRRGESDRRSYSCPFLANCL